MWRMLWTARSFILVGLALIGYYGYQRLEGTSRDDLPLRLTMAGQVARQASLALPIPPGRPVVAVAPVTGDYRGILTEQLRQWAARRNATIVELEWWEPLLPEPLRTARQVTPEEATQRAARRKVPYVVHARVREWVTDPYEHRQLALEVQLINVELSVILYHNQFNLETESEAFTGARSAARATTAQPSPSDLDLAAVVPSIRDLPAPYQPHDKVLMFVVWLASGLVLPWLGASVVGQVIRSDSNVASLSLVAGYLAFMGLLAWYLWGRFEAGLLTWTFILLLSSVWLGYLEFVCRMLDNRPEQL